MTINIYALYYLYICIVHAMVMLTFYQMVGTAPGKAFAAFENVSETVGV